GEIATIDLGPDEAEAAAHERADAGAVRTADRHADDDVAHQVDDAVIAEVALRAEEARAPAEVQFAADDAGAHRARVDAEASAAVIEAAPTVGGYPGADEPVRSRDRRRGYGSDRRRHDQGFHYTPHDVSAPSVAGACVIGPGNTHQEPH